MAFMQFMWSHLHIWDHSSSQGCLKSIKGREVVITQSAGDNTQGNYKLERDVWRAAFVCFGEHIVPLFIFEEK